MILFGKNYEDYYCNFEELWGAPLRHNQDNQKWNILSVPNFPSPA